MTTSQIYKVLLYESPKGNQSDMEQAQEVCMVAGITLFEMHFDFLGAWSFTFCLGPFRF